MLEGTQEAIMWVKWVSLLVVVILVLPHRLMFITVE
jgi:hypothetical protein